MTFMLILSASVIAALILSGRAKTMRSNDWLAVAIALLGVNFCRGGNWMTGGALIAAMMAWRGSKILGTRFDFRKFRKKDKPEPHKFELERARSLLGVSESADKAAINAAWRSHLTAHHPDRGGDENLARQINRARDLLLAEVQAANQQ